MKENMALLFEDHDRDESERVFHMTAKVQTRIHVIGNITTNHIGLQCKNAMEFVACILTYYMQHSDR